MNTIKPNILKLVFSTEQSKIVDQNLISGTDPFVVGCTDSGILLLYLTISNTMLFSGLTIPNFAFSDDFS